MAFSIARLTHHISFLFLLLFLLIQDYGLHATLSEFRCTPAKCPYSGGAVHPIGARSHSFNAAAIPEALAEEVAEYVHAKFMLDRIRYTKEMTPSGGFAVAPDEATVETHTITSSEDGDW